MEDFAANYTHPAGLYVAHCYASADAYHKDEKALARWESNMLRVKEEATTDLLSYSYEGLGSGRFKINNAEYTVENPREGSVKQDT